MTAPDSIKQLVERFEQHREAYRAGKYNETQLRREFLDPFFEALGWDVFNKLGYSEENKHVIHEDSLEIEGAKKAPDYAFKVGKERKFFVEAKKPSVRIETNPEVAFQLKRYVWSAKLPLGILTDFEEFAVYECRSKPKVSDSVKTGRVMLLNYTDYIERWDEIASIFSYNAVMTGGFEKFANSAAKKKGTAEVDSAFLAEIEGWRETLAKNIALRNKEKTRTERSRSVHSEADLNYAVQMTIDRMIFLRICEDRGYESEYQLQELANPPRSPHFEVQKWGEERGVYRELVKLFERADKRYNSGLFHFPAGHRAKEEKGRGRADTFTTGLEIDDKVLKDILKDLYYPSPYVFALIPADILGQIYEQFLGKVIRLTAGGNAKVEEKPEVRKAGGVYYTPTFIVDTIVVNTLGKLLNPTPPLTPPHLGTNGEGKMTPKEAARLKILDPACGSGTFLLGAYQYLLDWHLTWYMNNGFEKWSKGRNAVLVQGKEGWKLTVEKKKEILLNNIHGVDIDPQAVEVTKLSLLLKVIEDPGQLSYLDERILPDLGRNIQCGNSLIGPDYWDGQLGNGKWGMVNGEEERARVNAFDWKAAFPEVFAQGGFDAVVGNPPYGALLSPEIKKYLSNRFPFVSDVETSQYFIAKSEEITKHEGFVAFIVPNTLFLNLLAQKFRRFIISSYFIVSIANLSEVDVFKDATVRTVIPILQKSKLKNPEIELIEFENAKTKKSNGTLNQNDLLADDKLWFTGLGTTSAPLREKIQGKSILLGDVLRVSQGLIPYDKYRGHDEYTIKNRIWHSDKKKDKTYKRELRGGDVTRYSVVWNGNQWISYGDWLAAPRKPEFFIEPRLLFREITDPKSGLLHVAYSEEEYYNNPGIINCISKDTTYSLLYLLGICASRMTAFFHFSSSPKARKGVFPKILVNDVRNLPVRTINFSDPAEKAQHDKMVSLVERMLALRKSLASTHNPQEADRLTREVESVDKSIDGLVYELYGLSQDEVKIVEGR